jgi:hypothetical protein
MITIRTDDTKLTMIAILSSAAEFGVLQDNGDSVKKNCQVKIYWAFI